MSGIERQRAARMLAEGRDPEDVAALVDGVNMLDPDFVRLVQWHRDAMGQAVRLSPEYLAVRTMGLVDEMQVDERGAETNKPALDAKDRARLMMGVHKLVGAR